MIINLTPNEVRVSSKMKKVDTQMSAIFEAAFQAGQDLTLPNSAGQGQARRPTVGEQFWCIIRILRFVGSTPINYKVEGILNTKTYYFDPFSWRNLLPLCPAILFTFLWVKYFLELVAGVPFIDGSFRSSKEQFFKFTSSQANGRGGGFLKQDIIRLLIFGGVSIQQILTTIFSWIVSSDIAKFLNDWDSIEMDFRSVFRSGPHDPPLTFISLTRWRNRFFMFYVCIPLALVLPPYLGFNMHFDKTAEVIFVSGLCVAFFAIPLLEDVKIIFMLKIVAEAFLQTKYQISRKINANHLMLGGVEIGQWRGLICGIRAQCKFLGQFLKCPQLLHLTTSTVVITCLTFVLFTGDYSEPEVVKSCMACLAYLFMMISQICVKTIIADQITECEREIAEELRWMQSQVYGSEALAEVKFLHDSILLDPARVTLGNYVCLSKKLLLSIFSQVVTYIIVLLQLTQK